MLAILLQDKTGFYKVADGDLVKITEFGIVNAATGVETITYENSDGKIEINANGILLGTYTTLEQAQKVVQEIWERLKKADIIYLSKDSKDQDEIRSACRNTLTYEMPADIPPTSKNPNYHPGPDER